MDQHKNPWAEKLSQVSLPDTTEAWRAMEARLDRDDRRTGRDKRRWVLLILLLLLLIGVCNCPASRKLFHGNSSISTQPSTTPATAHSNPLSPAPTHQPPASGPNAPNAAPAAGPNAPSAADPNPEPAIGPKVTPTTGSATAPAKPAPLPGEAAALPKPAPVGSTVTGQSKGHTAIFAAAKTFHPDHKSSKRNHSPRQPAVFKSAISHSSRVSTQMPQLDDQSDTLAVNPPTSNPPTSNSPTSNSPTSNSSTPNSSTARKPTFPSRPAPSGTRVDSLAKDSLKSTHKKPTPSPADKKQSSKEHGLMAGIGLNYFFPLGAQQSPYNSSGATGTLSDYIPVPMLRYYFNRKIYIQLEAQFNTPQSTKKDLLISYPPLDSIPGTLTRIQSSATIQQLYYFNLPISVHYTLFDHLDIGAGLQFSRLSNAIGSFDSTITHLGSTDTVNTKSIKSFKTDPLYQQIKTNEFRFLLDGSYTYKHIIVGLRYNQALSKFVNVQLSPGQVTQGRNSSLQLYLRYILWDGRKNHPQ